MNAVKNVFITMAGNNERITTEKLYRAVRVADPTAMRMTLPPRGMP